MATEGKLYQHALCYIQRNPLLRHILDMLEKVDLPNWYIASGAVAQTIWNGTHDYHPEYGIKDYDIVYCDATAPLDATLPAIPGALLDVKNQALVHTWFPAKFGRCIAPYYTTEQAIRTWATTASTIGITQRDGEIILYAPYGLADVLSNTVRLNPHSVFTAAEISRKLQRWRNTWPLLQITDTR